MGGFEVLAPSIFEFSLPSSTDGRLCDVRDRRGEREGAEDDSVGELAVDDGFDKASLNEGDRPDVNDGSKSWFGTALAEVLRYTPCKDA